MSNKYWLLLHKINLLEGYGGTHKIEKKVKETALEQRATKKMQNFLYAGSVGWLVIDRHAENYLGKYDYY